MFAFIMNADSGAGSVQRGCRAGHMLDAVVYFLDSNSITHGVDKN